MSTGNASFNGNIDCGNGMKSDQGKEEKEWELGFRLKKQETIRKIPTKNICRKHFRWKAFQVVIMRSSECVTSVTVEDPATISQFANFS